MNFFKLLDFIGKHSSPKFIQYASDGFMYIMNVQAYLYFLADDIFLKAVKNMSNQ